MVLIASASDHRHRRAAKSSRPAAPVPLSPSPPAAKSSARSGLHPFSFSWGAQRRLRCSKDGAPVYDSAYPSPPEHTKTPSPDKEEDPKPRPQDTPAGCSARPQRPRNLRPLRYAASRPEGAGHQAALQSPKPAQAPPRKRGFAVALTPEEIAHDFAAIRRCATRPVPAARRSSKKRSNRVQNTIDAMCPGLTLLNVDLDNYKIEEVETAF
ncbi:hypothetical protein ACQ4PT_008110 [Festuca glaucescens]